MKTSLFTKTAGAGLGLLFLAVASSNAAAVATDPVKPAAAPTHLCAGASVVPVTAVKTTLPNGRGPLVTVQVGTKTVCHMCPVTTTVTTNAWPSHRGPLTTTQITKVGAEHTCTACTEAVASL